MVTKKQVEKLKKDLLQFDDRVEDNYKQKLIDKIEKIAERQEDSRESITPGEVVAEFKARLEEEEDPLMKKVLSKGIEVFESGNQASN